MSFIYNTTTVEIGDVFKDEQKDLHVYVGSNNFKKITKRNIKNILDFCKEMIEESKYLNLEKEIYEIF